MLELREVVLFYFLLKDLTFRWNGLLDYRIRWIRYGEFREIMLEGWADLVCIQGVYILTSLNSKNEDRVAKELSRRLLNSAGLSSFSKFPDIITLP